MGLFSVGLGFASAHGYTKMNPCGFGDSNIADSVAGALQAQGGGLGAAEVAGESEEVAAEAGAVVEDAVEP